MNLKSLPASSVRTPAMERKADWWKTGSKALTASMSQSNIPESSMALKRAPKEAGLPSMATMMPLPVSAPSCVRRTSVRTRRTTESEEPHGNEVIRALGDLFYYLLEVFPFPVYALDLQPRGHSLEYRHVGVGDNLEALCYERVMDLSGVPEYLFLPVFLRQAVLHLDEPRVVELCRVHMAAGE